MLDGHFQFGGRRVAIGADPDLLFALAEFFASLGADDRRRGGLHRERAASGARFPPHAWWSAT